MNIRTPHNVKIVRVPRNQADLESSMAGKRMLLSVRLGQRESYLDWLDLGRDLTKRSLAAPFLVISDGAPGLIKAIEELWPKADRQRCTVHRLRNIILGDLE